MRLRRNSFTKEERIVRAAEFRQAMKNAHRIQEYGVVLYCKKTAREIPSRLGIIVGRKAFHRAPDRNRLRRIVRDFFRTTKPQFAGSFDFVVQIQRDYNLLKDNNLKNLLRQIFGRAGAFQVQGLDGE